MLLDSRTLFMLENLVSIVSLLPFLKKYFLRFLLYNECLYCQYSEEEGDYPT
jgi:hypothetical protein